MNVKITAIGALCLLESIALLTHTDGAYLLPIAAIIGGIAGYEVRGLKAAEKEKTAWTER